MDDRSYNNPSNNVAPTGGIPGGGVAMPNSGTMTNGGVVNGNVMPVGETMPRNGMPVGGAIANSSAMPAGGTVFGTGMPNGSAMYSGGMMPGNGPISSGTGDIVLNNGGGGKSKKGLIIGAIVGVLVIVGIAVGAVMMNGGGLFGDKERAITSMEEKFNMYANYYLYGKDNDASEVDYSGSMEDTFFESTVHGDDAWDEYALKLLNYYDVFYEGTLPEELEIGFLEFYKTKLRLVVAYYSGASVNFNELLSVYSSGGSDYATNWIKEKIEPYRELQMVSGINYYDELLNWANGNMAYIELIGKNGCIDNGTIVYQCISDSVTIEGDEILRGVSDHFWKTQSVLKECENDLFSSLFVIKDYMDDDYVDGGNNESE